MGDTLISRRVIAAAVRVYPPEFRAEYGDEMRTVAHDMLREAHARGPAAVLATGARIIGDLIAGAVGEHTRKESGMRVTTAGVGAGVALIIGLPALYASYSSYEFWGAVSDVSGMVGVDSTSVLVHPAIVVACATLVTVGLLALTARITAVSARVRMWLRALVVAAGAALALGGTTMLAFGMRRSTGLSWSWVRESILGAGTVLGAVAFLLLPTAVTVLAVLVLRTRALGVLSVAPALVAGSLVLITGIGLYGAATGARETFLLQPPIAVAMWALTGSTLLLGVAMALVPSPSARRPVRAAVAA